MKNITLAFCLFGLLTFLTSCVEEEDVFIETEVEVEIEAETVEEPTPISGATSIIFSYNVHDNESGITTSWLIDDVGKVRKMEHSPILDYHESELSFYDLNRMKSESIETNVLVNRQELKDNLSLLKATMPASYSSERESKFVTTIYGYYFSKIVRNTGSGNSCSCSNGPNHHQSVYFEYRLLQQKMGDDIVVSAGDDIIAWINSLNLEAL